MADGTLLCALADDDWPRDVIDTGNAFAEKADLIPAFVHVAQVDFPASSSVIPAGAAAGWAPFPEGGYRAAVLRARDRAAEFLDALGLKGPRARPAAGSPTSVLQAIAAEIDAEAIVVGGRPGGAIRALSTGSVARWLTVNGDRPVMFARGQRPVDGPVVCGIDPAGGDALRVARVAARFAALLRQRLVLVYVGNFGVDAEAEEVVGYENLLEGNRRAALRRIHRLVDELADGIAIEVALESGWEPLRLAAQADARAASVVVVGNRGHGPIRSALVGSISLELANVCRQVVVVVPPAS